jgi:hypothetical protein
MSRIAPQPVARRERLIVERLLDAAFDVLEVAVENSRAKVSFERK